jgi:hypothetical protein
MSVVSAAWSFATVDTTLLVACHKRSCEISPTFSIVVFGTIRVIGSEACVRGSMVGVRPSASAELRAMEIRASGW